MKTELWTLGRRGGEGRTRCGGGWKRSTEKQVGASWWRSDCQSAKPRVEFAGLRRQAAQRRSVG
ncbi:hypothetical protein J1614_006508 [Plenodomus biglobosus]|nr:hypothetical protein J1614_006508 [Plenodomus biglobosus]